MKVVIDIPDDWERRIKCNIRPNTIECGEFVESIWKGKMLPKGYGRLIDADELRKKWIFGKSEKKEIDDAPTIIEADKEAEDGH